MESIDNPRHRAEAKARWGGTEQYRESAKRTAGYTDDDWKAIHGELDAIESDFAAALEQDVEPTSEQALALAERAREHIDRWYYACSREMHARLAEMYTEDERFKAHYDDRRPGLAEFVRATIEANAARG